VSNSPFKDHGEAHRGWWPAMLTVVFGTGCVQEETTIPASPVTGPEPASMAMVELVAEQEIWANARVIGFGETTHGTREFREMFYEGALMAVRGENALTVALEVSPSFAREMNEWIEGCGSEGYGRQVVLPRLSAADRAFLERARHHNMTYQQCIRVVGVDAPVGGYTVALMKHYGQSCLAPESYSRLEPHLLELEAMSALYGTGDGRPREILQNIEREFQAQERPDHCAELDWWVHLTSQHIDINGSSRRVGGVPDYVHTVDRDEMMASNVMFWAERGEKVFWLAHAFHVAAVEYPDVRGGGKSVPAGVHLRRSLGDQYASIGMFFGEGTLFAFGCVARRKGTVRRIPPPRRPSLQADLLQDFARPTLLDSPTACHDRNCREVRVQVYCLPRGWRDPSVSYLSLDVDRAFDWLAFFPTATADILATE